MESSFVIALLRWNHLNPQPRWAAYLEIAFLMGGLIYAFWPVVRDWYRRRK